MPKLKNPKLKKLSEEQREKVDRLFKRVNDVEASELGLTVYGYLADDGVYGQYYPHGFLSYIVHISKASDETYIGLRFSPGVEI